MTYFFEFLRTLVPEFYTNGQSQTNGQTQSALVQRSVLYAGRKPSWLPNRVILCHLDLQGRELEEKFIKTAPCMSYLLLFEMMQQFQLRYNNEFISLRNNTKVPVIVFRLQDTVKRCKIKDLLIAAWPRYANERDTYLISALL